MSLKLLLVGEPCVAPLTHEWPCVGQKVLLKGKSAGQASDTAKVTAVSLPQLRFGSDR